jgi:hypothetical protein
MKRYPTTILSLALAVLPCAVNAAETAPARTDVRTESTTRPLDLKAPEIGKIFSLAQINEVLSRAVDPALEFVEVEALRLGDLPAEDTSATPAERLARTALWLFAPSATFAANERTAPDATYPLRPAPYLLANYHPSFEQP